MTIQKYRVRVFTVYIPTLKAMNSWQLTLLGNLLTQPSNCTKIWYFLVLSCFSKLHFAIHQLKQPEEHIREVKYKNCNCFCATVRLKAGTIHAFQTN